MIVIALPRRWRRKAIQQNVSIGVGSLGARLVRRSVGHMTVGRFFALRAPRGRDVCVSSNEAPVLTNYSRRCCAEASIN